MQSGNPVLATAGLFTDISSKGAQLFGTNNNSISDTQRNTVGLNRFQQIANNVLGGASNMLSFGLLGGNRVNDAYKSGIVDEYSDSFAGSSRRINNIGSMGGKKYVIGGKKINDAVQTSNRENEIITSLGLTNNPIKSSLAYNMDSARDSYLDNLYGKQMYIKNGALLPSKEELKKIYASRKVLDNPTIVLKEGGVIGVDTNVIPEGSLHATKNHLEEVNPELDKVTEKGIPVVVTDENGDYTQVAEIEKEELVFTKSLTDKIEEL